MAEREGTTEAGDRRLYFAVVEEVMRAVALGVLSAGDRLPNERELAARATVSRTTVREALLVLELCGVIEIRPGSGCYLIGMGSAATPVVGSLVNSSPRELLEARQIVEPPVARLCAHTMRAAGVARLLELLDDAERENENPTNGKFDRFASLSLAFHRELGASCGNSILAEMTSHLADSGGQPLWYLVEGIVVRDPSVRAKQVAEHRSILEAISAQRADDAAEAMAMHLGAVSARIFGPEVAKPKVSRVHRGRS